MADFKNTEIEEIWNEYTGPKLVKATLDEQDVFSSVNSFYGKELNWHCKTWTAMEMFGEYCVGKEMYFEFKGEDGRVHWSRGKIEKLDETINKYGWMPFNQNQAYWDRLTRERESREKEILVETLE